MAKLPETMIQAQRCRESLGNAPPGTAACASNCPHVDLDDARCSHRFSIGRLDQAFRVCFGAFHGCPIYHRINGELDARLEHHGRTVPFTALTVARREQSLRATGT